MLITRHLPALQSIVLDVLRPPRYASLVTSGLRLLAKRLDSHVLLWLASQVEYELEREIGRVQPEVHP